MIEHPLEQPDPGSEVTEAFLRYFGIRRELPRAALLDRVVRAFARIPYENLTKIVKLYRLGSSTAARRLPREVVGEHVDLGAGGTCFALTACLLHILRSLGWEAEPLLADRRYGENTHCALRVTLEGRPHILDPGFLILQPVALDSIDAGTGLSVSTAFNDLRLEARDGGSRIDLSTVEGGSTTYRLTFKAMPADSEEFLRAWDASFGWDMMRYPLLTRVSDAGQLYLQNRRLQIRNRGGVDRREIELEELPRLTEATFGISAKLAARALEVLARQGEL